MEKFFGVTKSVQHYDFESSFDRKNLKLNY